MSPFSKRGIIDMFGSSSGARDSRVTEIKNIAWLNSVHVAWENDINTIRFRLSGTLENVTTAFEQIASKYDVRSATPSNDELDSLVETIRKA